SRAPRTRATVSDALPAANGTTRLTGRVGQSSAAACCPANTSAVSPARLRQNRWLKLVRIIITTPAPPRSPQEKACLLCPPSPRRPFENAPSQALRWRPRQARNLSTSQRKSRTGRAAASRCWPARILPVDSPILHVYLTDRLFN